MSTSNGGTRYDEDFKHTLVNLYQSGAKHRLRSVGNMELRL